MHACMVDSAVKALPTYLEDAVALDRHGQGRGIGQCVALQAEVPNSFHHQQQGSKVQAPAEAHVTH
jgi:hypothetical protein